MTSPGRLLAVFDDAAAATAAQRLLQSQGIDAQTSIDLTADPVAGEMPGQSFQNQPGQGADDLKPAGTLDLLLGHAQAQQDLDAKRGSAVRSAGCILTIDAGAGSLHRAREMATALGARRFV